MRKILQEQKSFYGYLFISGIALLYSGGLVYMVYFLERTDTTPLLLCFGFLFLLYLLSYRQAEKGTIFLWIGLAVLLRLLLLPSLPTLSDDFYRFIWDGRLLLAGEHPFAHLPSWYMETTAAAPPPGINEELYQHLNSPNYYSIYPPLNQGVFVLAGLISPDSIRGSVIVMRCILILAEIGTILLLYHLLISYGKPIKLLLLYALNPLVILELSGNLHFEALMIFFLLLCLYTYKRFENSGSDKHNHRKWLYGSALALAGAISSKLIPLLFIPLWKNRLQKKQFFLFCGLSLFATFLLFLPLFDFSLLKGMGSSISLYYQKFEFNAGLYYLLREIGFRLVGNNIIIQAGPFLALLTISCFLLLSRKKPTLLLTLPEAFFWGYATFLVFSLTVHPWYLTPLLALSVLTRYRFAVLWTGLVFLTYSGYGKEGYNENMTIVAFEYSCVFLFALWEWRKRDLRLEI